MQVHLFEAFVILSEELNFRRAADRLSISQPGLTQQIRQLERELGAQLFARDRSGSRLTPAGAELLPLAKAMVEVVGQVVAVAARRPVTRPVVRPRVRVGLLGDGLGGLTWPVIEAFSRHRPDVDIVLSRLGFLEAFHALETGLADVVMATGPLTSSRRQDVLTLSQEPIAAVVSSGHPLAQEPTADLERVARSLTYDTPAGSDPAFRRFWILEDLRSGAPRDVSRLRRPTDSPILDHLLRRVGDVGGVGLWPASIPVEPSSGCVVRPLDRHLFAPRQLAARTDDEQAQTMLTIARELFATSDPCDVHAQEPERAVAR